MTHAGNHVKPAILVVDDEKSLRLNAADMLEDNGYAVLEAASAEDALKTLESRPDVRLLFTDIHMPGPLDGIQLARLVHECWPHIPTVMTSGRQRPSRAEIPDDSRFMPKPYRARDLLGHVAEMVPRSDRLYIGSDGRRS